MGSSVLLKLCRNLCSFKWLKYNLSRLNNLIPSVSCISKTEFPLGLIKLQDYRKSFHYTIVLLFIYSLKSGLESKINPKCFWLLASCTLVPLGKTNLYGLFELKTVFAAQPWWTDLLRIFVWFSPQILHWYHLYKLIQKK